MVAPCGGWVTEVGGGVVGLGVGVWDFEKSPARLLIHISLLCLLFVLSFFGVLASPTTSAAITTTLFVREK